MTLKPSLGLKENTLHGLVLTHWSISAVFTGRNGLQKAPDWSHRKFFRKKMNSKEFNAVSISNGQDWYDFRTKVNQTMLQPKTAKLYIPQVEEVVSELVTK